MSKPIPDYTESQVWTLAESLKERFLKDIDIQLIDSEIRLNSQDDELTNVPGLYWEADDCHFLILKTGLSKYRCQFFYQADQQYGTDIDEYNEFADCIMSLLQVQAEYDLIHKQETDAAAKVQLSL